MTDIELRTLLADARHAGTCFVRPHERIDMMAAAAALDFAVKVVDLSSTSDKPTLLNVLAAALEFPADFGHNWDALADSLGDFSWNPAAGYMLLLDNITTLRNAAPEDFDTLRGILDDASCSHALADVPFWVLFPHTDT